MLSNNLFFSKDVLFIIGPIGFNFIILKLKFIFNEKLGKRRIFSKIKNKYIISSMKMETEWK